MAAGDLITTDWQIEWRGTLLGSGTAYGWQNLSGWLELPGTRMDDQARPFRHGAYAGQLLADERVITFEMVVMPWGATTIASAVDTLRRITALEEAPDEEPLVVRLLGQSWQVMARCDKRALPADRMLTVQAAPAAVQWVATDPRLYSPGAQQNSSVGLPQSGVGGLVFPLVFPLTFGAGKSGGEMTLLNTGTVTTWPTWQITGPVTGPSISNVDTGETLVFDPTFTVPAGQTLTINTDARTVAIGAVNYRSKLFAAQWFGLRAGVSTKIRFTSAGSYDPAAQLTALWRHATI